MKHIQLLTSQLTLYNYVKDNNSIKIDRFVSLYTYPEFQKKIVESFDKIYSDTKFKVIDNVFDSEYSNYKDHKGYQIFFNTDSGVEYRIDLIPVINYNVKINSDFVWLISFTLNTNDIDSLEYEKLTNLFEEKEVLIRIGNILNQLNIDKNFIISQTIDPRKIKLYKNILFYVFKNYNVDLSYCDGMVDNKGLYIWK